MTDVLIRDKSEYHARTTSQMERHLAIPPWTLRQKIAQHHTATLRLGAAERIERNVVLAL